MNDLAIRLRHGFSDEAKSAVHIEIEAADAIERLEAENAKLRAALSPFASMAKNYVGFADGRVIEVPVSIGELRAAMNALSE